MKVDFKIEGIADLVKDLQTRNVECDKDIERVIKIYTLDVHGEARKRAPVDTGQMRRQIRFKFTRNKSEFVGEIISHAEYSPHVEYGHIIKKGQLVPLKIDGKQTFRTVTETKFVPAQPFMNPAFDLYKEDFLRDITKALKQITD